MVKFSVKRKRKKLGCEAEEEKYERVAVSSCGTAVLVPRLMAFLGLQQSVGYQESQLTIQVVLLP